MPKKVKPVHPGEILLEEFMNHLACLATSDIVCHKLLQYVNLSVSLRWGVEDC